MSRRKVALLRTNFLPYSETFIHDELRHHTRYDATVFARQLRNTDWFQGHEVVAVETVPAARRPLRSALYGATGFSPRLELAFARGGFDIIHAHFGHNGLYGMGWALRYRVPLVVSLHGRDVSMLIGRDRFTPRWWHYWAGSKLLCRIAARFFAASNEMRDLIIQAGCPPEKVVVHRLGVDLTNFEPGTPPAEGEPAQLVMVGRFVEKKGHETGLRAMARARDAGHRVRMAILGDGPLRPRYDALIGELGLEGQVEFPGPLPHDQVVARLRRATALLAPSQVAANQDRESGLIVAKEAAACALPVIGTIHGGIPEIIDDGETGYLVPERDDALMGARLCALLADRSLRERMGAAARKKMESEYDIRDRVAALEDLYDEVIERR